LSVTNGHAIIPDMRMRTLAAGDLAVHLDHLRSVRFVREIRLTSKGTERLCDVDAIATIETARRSFRLGVEVKRTFLSQSATGAVIADHLRLEREHRLPVLLAARYIPRPTGERLAAAGVNFVDRVGNIHLNLGDAYHALILGRRDIRPEPASRGLGPAWVKILFMLLADPTAAGGTVRAWADAAGSGRTAAGEARQRLIGAGILARRRGRDYAVIDQKKLADEFVEGYGRILRPHATIGRFRPAERGMDHLVQQFGIAATHYEMGWAMTGAPAAYALQRFYRGEQIPVLVSHVTPAFQRELNLAPDREGPVTLLRAFGRHYVWRTVGTLPVAHPWLIYAELIHQGDPRALEAADHLREEYLQP
jgi:hypothetical protein